MSFYARSGPCQLSWKNRGVGTLPMLQHAVNQLFPKYRACQLVRKKPVPQISNFRRWLGNPFPFFKVTKFLSLYQSTCCVIIGHSQTVPIIQPNSLHAYVLWNELERYFCQMNIQMGFDPQRNWSEVGKTGRILIIFIGLIISSSVRHVLNTTCRKKQFASTQDILDEMRSILCI